MEHYALILEDNPAFAAFVNKSLEQAGFQVHHAANHDDLNMLMNEREYDVAIFDLSTGGEKDGVQCITC